MERFKVVNQDSWELEFNGELLNSQLIGGDSLSEWNVYKMEQTAYDSPNQGHTFIAEEISYTEGDATYRFAKICKNRDDIIEFFMDANPMYVDEFMTQFIVDNHDAFKVV